jgi:hypothetical protein
MSNERPPNENDFTDLSSFESVKMQSSSPDGNVIKKHRVTPDGIHRIEVHEDEGSGASVIVHREGEQVNSIEVVCKCGCTTTVNLEYNGE